MARFKEVPHVMRTVGWFTFAKRVWQQINEDNIFTWGSALAYSWMFAIFPFLIFLLSLVGRIPERFKPDVEKTITKVIDQSVPSSDAADLIKAQANSVLHPDPKQPTTGILSFGLVLTLWAASGGMSVTMTALDKAYDIEKSRSFIRQRITALFLTLFATVLLILVMILLPVAAIFIAWLSKYGASWNIPISTPLLVLFDIARYLIALLLLVAITSAIYHWGPNLKQKFHAVTPGAIFTIVVWLLLGLAFKLYITKFGGAASYNKTYGAVAGLVILLLFFYIDALVLLIGAEINSEIDFAVAGVPSGTTPEQKAVAPVPTPENLALRDELEDRRKETAEKMAADKSGGETTGQSKDGKDKAS